MSDPTYGYEIDGQNTEMTEADYARMVSEGAVTPGGVPDQTLQSQIEVMRRILAQIQDGTLPIGSVTGQPAPDVGPDIMAFEEIVANLPPEVQAQIMGANLPQEMAAGEPVQPPQIQPQNFGALPAGDPGAEGTFSADLPPGVGMPAGPPPMPDQPMPGAASAADMDAVRASREDPGFMRYLEMMQSRRQN